MRILYVAQNIPLPGTHGGSTHVTEVTRALRKLGNEVLVIARSGSTGAGVAGIGMGAPSGALRHVVAPLIFPAAYWHARRFRPDVVYERYSSYGLGVVLGRALGVPVVSMILDETATRITLGGARVLVTTAPEIIPERYRHKAVEVSWGANVDMFHPGVGAAELRAQLGFSPHHFVVGYTGAFYRWHGLDTLVESAMLLAKERRATNVRYLLVGDGERRAQIAAAVAASGIPERFVTIGKVPYVEVPRYVAASDLCVAPYNPSAHEPFKKKGLFLDPLKVFEYMAARKPTITLDSPNMRKMFGHREQALLVAPGRPAALAAAIVELLEDGRLRERIAARGYQAVLERHSWAAHGKHLTEIFSSLGASR